MEIVIHNLSNILAYIDDLLNHTKDHGKHLEVLDELFTRLRKHGLKINLPKSFRRNRSQLPRIQTHPRRNQAGGGQTQSRGGREAAERHYRSQSLSRIVQFLQGTCQKLCQDGGPAQPVDHQHM